MQSNKNDKQRTIRDWFGHPGTILTMLTLIVGLTAYIVRLEGKIDYAAAQSVIQAQQNSRQIARLERSIMDLTEALKNSNLEINRMKIGDAQVIERWLSIDRRLQVIERNTQPMSAPVPSRLPGN